MKTEKGDETMTFFEWIRGCLNRDAAQNPLPSKKGEAIRKRVKGIKAVSQKEESKKSEEVWRKET